MNSCYALLLVAMDNKDCFFGLTLLMFSSIVCVTWSKTILIQQFKTTEIQFKPFLTEHFFFRST